LKFWLGVLELAAWSSKNYSDKLFLWIKDRSTIWLFSKVSKQFCILVNWSTKLHFATATPLRLTFNQKKIQENCLSETFQAIRNKTFFKILFFYELKHQIFFLPEKLPVFLLITGKA
jgi:hypothetical protein